MSESGLRGRKWPRRVGVLALAGLLVVAATEVAFRVIVFPDWRSLSPQILVPHPVFLRFSASNLVLRQYDPPNFDVTIRTNSRGFRDREQGFEEDLAGVWLCGGSNVFGTGVNNEETMAAQIEKAGHRVANLAAEGSQIEIETRVIRHLMREGHRPKAVICVITTPGAIYDTVEKGWLDRFDDPLPKADGLVKKVAKIRSAADLFWHTVNEVVPITEQGTIFSVLAVKARLVKSSATYGWLKYGVSEIPAAFEWFRRKGIVADADHHISGRPELYLKEIPEPQIRQIRNMVRFVGRLRDLIRTELHVPFGVVLVPTQHQIYPEKFDKYVSHFGLTRESYDLSLPNKRMSKALEDIGIPALDLRPALLSRNDEALTFINNGHLNPKGQNVAAAEIVPWIERKLGVTPVASP